MLGELDGVSNQVDQDLTQVSSIAVQIERRLRCSVRRQYQPFTLSLRFHHGGDATDQSVQVEVFLGLEQTAGLDTRDIKHVVDQFQQCGGGGPNDLGKLPLLLAQLGFCQQVGHTHDPV